MRVSIYVRIIYYILVSLRADTLNVPSLNLVSDSEIRPTALSVVLDLLYSERGSGGPDKLIGYKLSHHFQTEKTCPCTEKMVWLLNIKQIR